MTPEMYLHQLHGLPNVRPETDCTSQPKSIAINYLELFTLIFLDSSFLFSNMPNQPPRSLRKFPENKCIFCGCRLHLKPRRIGLLSVEKEDVSVKAIAYVCYPYCDRPPIDFV